MALGAEDAGALFGCRHGVFTTAADPPAEDRGADGVDYFHERLSTESKSLPFGKRRALTVCSFATSLTTLCPTVPPSTWGDRGVDAMEYFFHERLRLSTESKRLPCREKTRTDVVAAGAHLLRRDLNDPLHHRLRGVIGGSSGLLHPHPVAQAGLVGQQRRQIALDLAANKQYSDDVLLLLVLFSRLALYIVQIKCVMRWCICMALVINRTRFLSKLCPLSVMYLACLYIYHTNYCSI